MRVTRSVQAMARHLAPNAGLVRLARRWVLPSALLACLVLVSCGPQIVYDYVPPDSAEGRVCATQCQNNASNCRQMKQMLDQQCRNNYNAMQQNYNACKESGAKHCVSPSPCPFSSTRECDQAYRECFAACGGQVIARTVE